MNATLQVRLRKINKACLLALVVIVSAAVNAEAQAINIVRPIGTNGKPQTSQSSTLTTTNGIDYHGGPVMLGPHHVYFIWYGNWNQNNATTILPKFIQNLNATAYSNINSTYSDGSGQAIANDVTLNGQVFDSYSQGTVLSDPGLSATVSRTLQNGSLPTDANGIYFVLSSADVDQRGVNGEFCVDFCGFHQHATLNGADIKFAFVGNSARCLSNCASPNLGIGPNGNAGADAMASIMAHELNEGITDPDLNAWFDSSGNEVGDKCNFIFGSVFTAPNGAPANVTLGDRRFLIQKNWINLNGGFCTIGRGFTVTAASENLLAEQVSSDSTTLSVHSLSGFSGDVTLSISPLPSGVSATFSPNPATTNSTSTLTLHAGRLAVPDTYLMTLVGKSAGMVSTIPINFTVTQLNTTN
jgi:hypothetical protein